MKNKEIKINIPEGYEIDQEKSTLECIKFKPIKKNITYKNVCNKLFKKLNGYFINNWGEPDNFYYESDKFTPNSAVNKKQLKRILALNQLLNIAEYYNKLHTTNIKSTAIEYDGVNQKYYTSGISIKYLRGISAVFNRKEDAQAVIDNPNFREILDTVYKD